MFFCFPDVLAGDGCEIDTIKGKAEACGEPPRGKRLSGAGGAGKKSTNTGSVSRGSADAKAVDEFFASPAAEKKAIQLVAQSGRHHQRCVGNEVGDGLRESFEAAAFSRPGGRGHILRFGAR